MNQALSKLSVITCCHYFTSGPGSELEEFLRPRTDFLVTANHPFYYSKLNHTFVNVYSKGRLLRQLYFRRLPRFGFLNYARDFITSLMLPLLLKRRFDYYIGGNPVNAAAGIILRRLGFVRLVVFYKIDYVPTRFTNLIMNSLYHEIDRFSSEDSDWTWNLAKPMIEERLKRGMRLGRQLIVPIGSNFDRIARSPASEVIRNRLVYMGSLRRGQGIELIIEALPRINKIVPQTRLMIIGTGPLESQLKSRVIELGLDSCVRFFGEIPDHTEVERILTTCGVGLAAYEPSSESYTRYTEPGKVKVYLACGLPVIITRVPEISKEIEKRGAGIIIDYATEDLAAAVEKLVSDEPTYQKIRSAAISFASEYTWDDVFGTAFNAMQGY